MSLRTPRTLKRMCASRRPNYPASKLALNPALVGMVAKAGVPLLGSRRLFTAVGFIVSALCILPVARLKHLDPWVSTALFTHSPAWPTPSSPNLNP